MKGYGRSRPIGAAVLLLTAMTTPTLAQVPAPPRTTLSIGLPLEPPVLDPTINPAEPIRLITNDNVLEELLRIDEDGRVQPLLARGWTVSADGLRYDFPLRGGVRFHDGAAFDCPVVRFSLGRAAASDSLNPQRQFFAPIKAVDCPSPLEAVVTLDHPVGSFPYDLAWPDAAMVSPGSVAGNATHPIGTGPYRFSSWRRGDSVVLERNDGYWGPRPAIQAVTFRFITDPLAATTALKAGQLDAYPSFPSPQLLTRFAHDPRFAVVTGSFPDKVILALNEARHPFDDVRVRHGLAMAIDRKAILQALDYPDGTVIGSHMAPSDSDYVDLSSRYPYDPAAARRLLGAAGVRPGTRIAIAIPPVEYARQAGELIAAYLGQVGLEAATQPVTWPQWLGEVFGHAAFDATVIAHVEPHDLDLYARPHYYFGYHDPAYAALYRRYDAAGDPAERHRLSAALQAKLADDEPNVFLFSLPRDNVWDARLRGLWANQPIPALPIAGVSWTP